MEMNKKPEEIKPLLEVKGEWILVEPTDCFTMLPIYECSKCKKTCYGYLLESICKNCGSKNKINTKRYIKKDIFMVIEDE